MSTNINNRLVCNEPHANLDSYYGPYDSVDAAFNALASTTVNGVTYAKRYVGLTVGIWNSAKTEITEYWFKGGTAKTNLVVKMSESGLPGGVKIVTFDKNGGSGVQNSIMTDSDGYVCLPECTLTNGTATFTYWNYEGANHNPGDNIKLNVSTVVKALWKESKTNYKVSWKNPNYGTITGKTDSGARVNNGDELESGTKIILQANANSGYQFSKWTRLPSGAESSGNTCSFTLNANVSGIEAAFDKITTQFEFTCVAGDGITELTGTIGDEEVQTKTTYKRDEGTAVHLTAVCEDGLNVVWDGRPDDAKISENGRELTFELLSNVDLTVTATSEPIQPEFYYYGCSSTEEERVESKCFEDPKQLNSSWTSQVNIENNKNNYLYVVMDNKGITPRCIPTDGDALEINKITECGDDELIAHLRNKNWITENGETDGDLKDYGNIMYLLIDKDKKISDGQPITISVKKS
jgi:hypothetical protein